jgi:signal transduction histidine kinase/CheY-like chemotaxis protein
MRPERFEPRLSAPPASAPRAPAAITLVAPPTVIWLLLLAVACVALVWGTEATLGQLAPSDLFAYPLLILWFLALALHAWRRPRQLLRTQRLASLGLAVYFIATVNYMLLVEGSANTYSLATLAYWLVASHLLLFVTWPLRAALLLSGTLLLLTLMPAVVVHVRGPGSPEWRDTVWPLFVNGIFAQLAVIAALAGLTRQFAKLAYTAAHDSSGDSQPPMTVDDLVLRRVRDLEHARDAAEQASQAKSRFLAVMSHELRTPLHGVLGAADLLRDRRPGDAEHRELVDTVRRGGTHLLHLINDVLDLSRIEAGRLELTHQPFDLHACFAQVEETMAPQAAAKGLRYETGIAPEVPVWVKGDPFRLKQVLLNLVGNAVKFTDRGRIGVQASLAPQTGELLVLTDDSGIGIERAQLAQVFDAFYQADGGMTRRHAGSGLGLAISRQLVHLMHGSLSIESEPAVGTRVLMRLPLEPCEPPAHANTGSGWLPAGDGLAGLRVLLVDDDPVNTMIAAQMLATADISVHTAATGRDALNQLTRGGFDLVLMDWRMPDMDGLEATRRLRAGEAGETSRHVPVVGLTANAYAEDRAACLASGMDEVLVKPVGRRQLLQTVQTVLEKQAP